MILDKIVEDKKLRLPKHKAKISEHEMRRIAEEIIREKPKHPSFSQALAKPGISIIGEIEAYLSAD